MNTTSHTPGQWLAHIDIDPNDSGLNDIRILEPSTETENLTANTIAVLNQNMGREAIANANLIAAAPDLLSALHEAYNAIAWDIPGGNLSDADSEALLDTIRAAISKAEGVK
jgi:hypothetical protein